MRRNVSLLLSLSLFPLLSFAQYPSDSPRFYLGAGGSMLTTQPFSSYEHTLAGPMLTAGVWLHPRLAVQLSGTVAWAKNDPSYTNYPIPPPGTTSTEIVVYTFPLLVRGALLPADKKFNVDVLAGYTLLHSANIAYFITDKLATASTNRHNLTLGPSLRYSFTPHLAVTATPLFNLGLSETQYISLQNRLLCNLMAGIHYSFN